MYMWAGKRKVLNKRKGVVMNLTMGNKNVVVGLVVILVYLSMTFFIERAGALHPFHDKAAAAVIDAKGSTNLLEHQVVDMKRGPAYRTGGIYFTNYYPASYVRVPNAGREAGYNMRLYAWMFALFNIAIGFIVGVQTEAGWRLRVWTSWLAFAGVLLYPLRDLVSFWVRWLSPYFSMTVPGRVLYPTMWIGGVAMGLALFLSIIVFVTGARKAGTS
jgi:hypothetical protein